MRPLSAAIGIARWLDHRVGRGIGPARVLVDVRTPMNLAVLRPVWRHLADDPRVEVRFTEEPATGVRQALAADGLEAALIDRDAARWRRTDLAITADVWNHTELRRCRRRVNFAHGVAGKYSLDDPQRLADANLSQYTRIAFANADRLERYVAAGVVERSKAALVGLPKTDALVNGAWNRDDTLAGLGLSPSLPTVLYAPTFSTANSLHSGGEALVSALLHSGCNVVVKLHDRSMVPHPRYTDGIDWPARLAAFAGHPRFVLARLADISPLLAASDVLVTDHSTVGFEFALLDRPVIVFDAPGLKEAARIDAGKWDLLRSMAHVVTAAADLPDAIARALANPGVQSVQRRAAVDTLFAYPGTATQRALELVYHLLDLQPVERRGAETRPARAAAPVVR
jgi:hypothetical protein